MTASAIVPMKLVSARRAQVVLQRTLDHVLLEVLDAGCSVSGRRLKQGDDLPPPAGVGISCMPERMNLVGGQLEILSGSSETTVRARVPLQT